jgi:hypothetical protein
MRSSCGLISAGSKCGGLCPGLATFMPILCRSASAARTLGSRTLRRFRRSKGAVATAPATFGSSTTTITVPSRCPWLTAPVRLRVVTPVRCWPQGPFSVSMRRQRARLAVVVSFAFRWPSPDNAV